MLVSCYTDCIHGIMETIIRQLRDTSWDRSEGRIPCVCEYESAIGRLDYVDL